MLTLTKETGAGLANANTYALVADGDAYHMGHLYASAWDVATADKKAAALVMASRLIDSEFQFGGWKAISGQALQWPRMDCPEPDGATATFKASDYYPPAQMQANAVVVGVGNGQIKIIEAVLTVPGDVVPKAVVEATCELARELIIVDRTAAPAGEGLKYYNDAGKQTGYDKTDTRPIIPKLVQTMLAKYGSLISAKSGAVNLIRV
jgi:hypothetical protein